VTVRELPRWHAYAPKLLTLLLQGYERRRLGRDLLAGLNVAVVALPLNLALAIAAGLPPQTGLIAGAIGGLLIALLGGSRIMIGGPTAAFVPVVAAIVAQHGTQGLLAAMLMAALMLIAAGALRLGTLARFIPQPVVAGFTTGIALSIFTTQLPDLLGLPAYAPSAGFLTRWTHVFEQLPALQPAVVGVSLATLALILLLQRLQPRLPAYLLALLVLSGAALWLHWPVASVGSRFGALPAGIPVPHLAWPGWPTLQALLPSAFTIAFLAAVQGLLTAQVTDGMIGGRHRANVELMAEGAANFACAAFGAMPVTGAIARTTTGIRSGATSPLAGLTHAMLLALLLLALPLARHIPLAVLAAMLVLVALNMADLPRLRGLWRAPWGDRGVFLLTLALTVLINLTVAVEVGVVLAAFLFMHRMAGLVALESGHDWIAKESAEESADAAPADDPRTRLPPDVVAYRVAGPLFFAVASHLDDVVRALRTPPRVFILRLRDVPMLDLSGAGAVLALARRCRTQGTRLILTGVRAQPAQMLASQGFAADGHWLASVADLDTALRLAAADTPH